MTRRLIRGTLAAAVASTVLAGSAGSLTASASAVTPSAGWDVSSATFPTHIAPNGEGTIQINLLDAGATPSSGPVTVTDVLPPGVTAVAAGGMEPFEARILTEAEETTQFGEPRWKCSGTTVVTCTSNPAVLPAIPVVHTQLGELQLSERVGIKVAVGSPGAFTNQITVAGGGAPLASTTSAPLLVDATPPDYGFAGFDAWFTNADGTPDTQAGSHPYDATFFLSFNELANSQRAGGEPRNIEVKTPPGLFGDPGAVPRCTRAQLDGQKCPASSQIGIDQAGRTVSGGPGDLEVVPVYNMAPPAGVPVEFAFSVAGFHAFFDFTVTNGGGSAIVAHVGNLPQVQVSDNLLTLWGVPADASHDPERYAKGCENGCASGIPPRPFLTLPTSCTGPLDFSIRGIGTYEDPTASAEAHAFTHDRSDNRTGLTGCDRLSVTPTLSVAPELSTGDSASGLTVDLRLPQDGITVPEGLVASTLKDETVTLPEGIAVNPGQAAGLAACQPEAANVNGEGPSSCPPASKVGTVKVRSPLLETLPENELEGNIYVLPSNPPDVKLLLTASGDGVYLKLVGNVHLDEATGRLTTTFTQTPELPFSDLKLTFAGGAQAALITPQACGTYQTQAAFTPWNTPFIQDISASSFFAITSAAGGAPCTPTPPFTPSVDAGSSSTHAAAFTDFSLLFQGGDGQQRPGTISVKAPPGLAGMISHVTLCQEPQAAEGTCPASSQIGHSIVTAGAGPYPLVIPQPGQPQAPIYLTGPYRGAPFGLSIATPIVAGPFNLGTIVVRASIEVDPSTAQVTVTTDPLPQIVKGVPTHLRTIDAVIDRPGFMFNPTSCEPMSFSGQATGTQGGAAAISSRFQVGSCEDLPFKPALSASTRGITNKANGASLTVKLSQHPGEANIHKVNLQLPVALPSRLSTLQKSCTEAQFNANPAGCPAGSFIGTAKAVTPVLATPLTGPAILVSHGGAAFPDVEFMLQSEGVQIVLDGKTDIKKGITYSRFETVPDAPISSFEAILPQGPHGILTAYLPNKGKTLCTAAGLLMPTTITAQDGAQFTQSTKIAVTGCPKPTIKIKHTKITSINALITVTVSQPVTITVGGNGLKTTKQTLSAGTHQLKVPLTKAGKAARAHHKRTKLHITLKGPSSTARKTVSLKL